MLGKNSRSGAGTRMSTEALLVILLIVIPTILIITLVTCDLVYWQSSAQHKSMSDSPSTSGRPSHLDSLIGAQAMREGEDLSIAKRSPPTGISTTSPQQTRTGIQSGVPTPGVPTSMTPTAESSLTSGRRSAPFPPMVPEAIMPETEAYFMVFEKQLAGLRTNEVQVRGNSGKTLLTVKFSSVTAGPAPYSKLDVMPVTDDPKAVFSVINRENTPGLEIYGRFQELYGVVQMESETRAVLKYRGEPMMAVTLGDQSNINMIASLVANGKALGFSEIKEESSGRRLWVVRVNPGADWLCIMSVFLGMIAMPLPPV